MTSNRPRKRASSCQRMTCLSMSISGRLAATVLMQKARVVPTGRPLSSRLSMMGTTPVTLLYRGMPTRTATGTDHHCPWPRWAANQSCGTKPCRSAPRPTPMMTQRQTRRKMPVISSQAKRCRSSSPRRVLRSSRAAWPETPSMPRRKGCNQRSARSRSSSQPPSIPAAMPTTT